MRLICIHKNIILCIALTSRIPGSVAFQLGFNLLPLPVFANKQMSMKLT